MSTLPTGTPTSFSAVLSTSLRYSFQPSSLLDGYDIRGGELIPQYNDYRIHTTELDIRYGFQGTIKPTSLTFEAAFLRISTAAMNTSSWIYHRRFACHAQSTHLFALGGNTTFFTQLNYHQPLFERIHYQAGRFTIDKLFMRVFAETGNGWGGPLQVGNNLKSGIGAELRLSMKLLLPVPLQTVHQRRIRS